MSNELVVDRCTSVNGMTGDVVRCELAAGHDAPDEWGGSQMHYAETSAGDAIAWGDLVSEGAN